MGNSDRRFDRYSMVVHMSEFIWCHGTKCHTNHTLDRVRGSKGSKVLRTRKVKQTEWNKSPFGQGGGNTWAYFCSQSCLMDFMTSHIQRVVALDPRTEPQETPIDDPVRERSEYGYINTTIKERGVDTITE